MKCQVNNGSFDRVSCNFVKWNYISVYSRALISTFQSSEGIHKEIKRRLAKTLQFVFICTSLYICIVGVNYVYVDCTFESYVNAADSILIPTLSCKTSFNLFDSGRHWRWTSSCLRVVRVLSGFE